MAREKKRRSGGVARPTKPSRSQRRRVQWVIGVAVVVVAAAIVGYFAYQSAADFPGVAYPDQGNLHVQTLSEPIAPYTSDPPTSGPHLPYVAPWGIHNEPISKQLQVHNLEDGGVVVQYNCPTPCPELVGKLKAIVQRYDKHVVLAPYLGMKTRIALTAWTRLDAFDELDEGRVVKFISRYRGIDHHKR